MSTSLLYHAFGIRGYDYVKTEYQGGEVIFTLRQRPRTYRCPVCNSRAVAPRGHQERTFKTEHIGVGWDTIKDIQKRDLHRRFKKPRLRQLKQIAIDEICVGGGHRYLTVVLDLLTGAVVFVGDGKGADALKPFWKRLKAARAKVEAVATDMSAAYIKAVT